MGEERQSRDEREGASKRAEDRLHNLVDKVASGRGRERYRIDWGTYYHPEDEGYDPEIYGYWPDEDETDAYTELQIGISLLFRQLNYLHRREQTDAWEAARQAGIQVHQINERFNRVWDAVNELKQGKPTSATGDSGALQAKSRPVPPARPELRWDGKAWNATFAGKTRKLGKLTGLLYMSYALERPGPEGVKLIDIEMTAHGQLDDYADETAADAAPLLTSEILDEDGEDGEGNAELRAISFTEATSTNNAETLAGYQESRRQLVRQIYVSETSGDVATAVELKRQRDALDEEIKALQYRVMRGEENQGASKGHIDRVRNAITYARDEAIPKKFPDLAQHLQDHFHCEGNAAIYNPPDDVSWKVKRAG